MRTQCPDDADRIVRRVVRAVGTDDHNKLRQAMRDACPVPRALSEAYRAWVAAVNKVLRRRRGREQDAAGQVRLFGDFDGRFNKIALTKLSP